MNSGSSVVAAPTRVVAATVAKAARVDAITGTTIEPTNAILWCRGSASSPRTVRTRGQQTFAKPTPAANEPVNSGAQASVDEAKRRTG